MKKHILSMLVEDQPGVLTRIAGLFARRGFNIETITVGKTNQKNISKMVISVKAETDSEIEQIEKQVNKLVDTQNVTGMMKDSVLRELCLIKVEAKTKDVKEALFNLQKVYKAKFVDVDKDTMTIEIIGTPEKIDSFIEMLNEYGIKDISRTGVTAISRG